MQVEILYAVIWYNKLKIVKIKFFHTTLSARKTKELFRKKHFIKNEFHSELIKDYQFFV